MDAAWIALEQQSDPGSAEISSNLEVFLAWSVRRRGGTLACGTIPPVITADDGVKSVNTPGWPAVPGSKSGAGGASLPALYLESGHSRVPLSRQIRIRPGGAEFDA